MFDEVVITMMKKNVIMLTSTAVLSAVLLSGVLTGCASTVASMTGQAPVGVVQSERTFSQRIRDSSIERTALINLYKLDPRFKNNSRIAITSFFDAVLITGQVPDAHLKQLATQNLQAMPDVKVVHNELAVADQIGYQRIVQDSLITANIKRELFMQTSFNTGWVKITTEDGVVYLLGRMTQDKLNLLLKTVQQVGGIYKIISLVDVVDTNGMLVNPSPISSKTTATPDEQTPVALDNPDLTHDIVTFTPVNETTTTNHTSDNNLNENNTANPATTLQTTENNGEPVRVVTTPLGTN